MTRHSLEELDAMYLHLAYEVQMLHATHQLTIRTGKGLSGNVVLESFLLHARNLLEFLYLSGPYVDSVTAWDYLPDWTKERRFSKQTLQFFEEQRSAINKRITHISKNRLTVDPENEGWDTSRIVSELDAALQRFDELRIARYSEAQAMTSKVTD